MKTQFTNKTAKGFRTISNKTARGFNWAVKVVLAVWDNTAKTNALNLSAAELVEVKAAKEAAKADGLRRADFAAAAAYLTKWLNNSAFCQNGVLGAFRKDKESGARVFVARVSWTPAQVIDYMRRANRARLQSAAESGKGARTDKKVKKAAE